MPEMKTAVSPDANLRWVQNCKSTGNRIFNPRFRLFARHSLGLQTPNHHTILGWLAAWSSRRCPIARPNLLKNIVQGLTGQGGVMFADVKGPSFIFWPVG